MTRADRQGADRRIDSIQWLRGFAALVVLICHVNAASIETFRADVIPLAAYGINGVDIFFVISGFIIFYATSRKRAFQPLDFMVHRFIRVAPTYWLYSVLFFCLYFVMPSLFSRAVMTWRDLILSLAFVPHYNAIGELSPIIAVGWTLNFEMFFYVVFCLVRSQTGQVVPPLAGIFMLLVIAGAFPDVGNAALLSFTRPLILEFAFGCLIAWVFVSGRRIPPYPAIILLVLAVGLTLLLPTLVPDNGSVSPLETWRFAARGAPSALLVLAVTCGRFRDIWNVRALLFLGEISYSLYLTHTLVLRVVFAVYKRLGLTGAAVVLADIAAILVGIVAAVFAYLLVEKPVTSALAGLYRKASSPVPATAIQAPQ